jgi:UDPglucose--hexose-1-phosphate uridylyltransferase
MPELRKSPILKRWVIISTERAKRPIDFKVTREEDQGEFCPFCVGNEGKTPPEVLAYRDPATKSNSPGWKVRVVPNKFPALQIEGDLNRHGEGIYDMMQGIGAHEVIIESPDHKKNIQYLSNDHIGSIFWAIRERMLDLKKDARFRYILVFKNWGKEAGASLAHSHMQLIATPIIPKGVIEEMDGAKAHYDLKERCIFCDIIGQELKDKRRIVYQNEHFVSLSPFASRFPFETWVLPLKHVSAYETITGELLPSLVDIMKTVLLKLDKALLKPPFNFIIHTSPCNGGELPYYHWHIEIIPKLTKVAGFEWGSGFYINPTSPEDAAKELRDAEITNEDLKNLKETEKETL